MVGLGMGSGRVIQVKINIQKTRQSASIRSENLVGLGMVSGRVIGTWLGAPTPPWPLFGTVTNVGKM